MCVFLSPLSPQNGNTPTANERAPLRNVFLVFSRCKNDAIAELQESAALSTLHGAGPNLCVCVCVCVCVCEHAWVI